jgi:glycosyltransferase involved in cell wall biosynthesis
LDALLCGIPVISSNVGLFYNDIPEDCFVKINWERNNDIKYIEDKIKYAWENKDEIGKKGREWYLKNCRLSDWSNNMNKLVKYYLKV